jgi:hypothetical protein
MNGCGLAFRTLLHDYDTFSKTMPATQSGGESVTRRVVLKAIRECGPDPQTIVLAIGEIGNSVLPIDIER